MIARSKIEEISFLCDDLKKLIFAQAKISADFHKQVISISNSNCMILYVPIGAEGAARMELNR